MEVGLLLQVGLARELVVTGQACPTAAPNEPIRGQNRSNDNKAGRILPVWVLPRNEERGRRLQAAAHRGDWGVTDVGLGEGGRRT